MTKTLFNFGEKIVNAVNDKFHASPDKKLSRLTLTLVESKDIVTARGSNGKMYMIVYTSSDIHGYFIKGVLKQRNSHRPASYLCNGQAGTNAAQVAFWQEGEFVVQLTKEEVQAKWCQNGYDWQNAVAKGTLRYPRYLESPEIVTPN